jgi:3-oxoadipate enol-lactonase
VLARRGDAQLYWESEGSGEPVLLIMGLGMTAAAWWRTVPVLAERMRVVAFDNRGCGRSDRTPGPYTIQQLAEDAAGILDAADEDSAHVYGISLGGMIAQELVLRYPHRVRSLVLGASTPGGRRHELPDDATLEFLRRRSSMPAEEAVWASVPYIYGKTTRERHADRIGEDLAQRLRFPVDAAGYRAQLSAAWAHHTGDRLSRVDTPTLVLHGSEDRMVPVSNGRLLAEAIPGAHLEVLEAAGHLYPTDAPEADRLVLRFLTNGALEPQARTARAGRA